jgi:two-component system chemotaxis response regulator CheB
LAFGSRVIGIILSGNLDDGTSGVRIVKRRGGLVVVQDPEDALFPSMPQSAIEHVNVDRVVPLRGMAKTLAELMAQPAPEMEPSPMSGRHQRKLNCRKSIWTSSRTKKIIQALRPRLAVRTAVVCYGS